MNTQDAYELGVKLAFWGLFKKNPNKLLNTAKKLMNEPVAKKVVKGVAEAPVSPELQRLQKIHKMLQRGAQYRGGARPSYAMGR